MVRLDAEPQLSRSDDVLAQAPRHLEASSYLSHPAEVISSAKPDPLSRDVLKLNLHARNLMNAVRC